jgi:hypothetical protein
MQPDTLVHCISRSATGHTQSYTPVASIATCVHPAFSSHSASANNPCVVVGKRRTSRPTFLFVITRRDQHDAFCIAAWLARADRDGTLAGFLKPDLSPAERAVAQVEGWIFGVPGRDDGFRKRSMAWCTSASRGHFS